MYYGLTVHMACCHMTRRHKDGLPTIRPSEPGPINPTALIAIDPGDGYATNFLERGLRGVCCWEGDSPKVLQDAPPWYPQCRRAYEKRNSASCLQAARVDFAVVGERLASAILRSMPAKIHRWNG